MIRIQVFEETLSAPKERVQLPAVPRIGETLSLTDDHYVVTDVLWQALQPMAPPPGTDWAEHTYYVLRLIVTKKFPRAGE